jgi:hypothetical protein
VSAKNEPMMGTKKVEILITEIHLFIVKKSGMSEATSKDMPERQK